MKFALLILIIVVLLMSCTFAPAYDPMVNAKLAEIKTTATDLKSQCSAMTADIIHQRLEVPAMTLEAMTVYRSRASGVEKAASAILHEITAFEIIVKRKPPSPAYCQDKLDDIALTVEAILKPYGTLQ